MRLSHDPQTSCLSTLVLSFTLSLVFAHFLLFNTIRVVAQSSAGDCQLPSFRRVDHKLNPQNRSSSDLIAPSLTYGDLNRDGLPDLVITPAVASDVPLLTNAGDGAFRVSYFLDAPYRDAVIGDFNGDGKPDIAAITVFETVTTLLGDGTGSFLPLNSTGGGQATRVGRYSTALRAGDFNRDGKLDVVVVNTLSNSLSILLGKGNGNFLAPVNYKVQENPHSLAVGDFNGDGALDVVTANEYSETVTLLLNDGTGGFSSTHFPAGALPQEVIAWDFNHDGKSDLAVVNRGYNTVTVLRNDGSGNFTLANRWELPFTSSSIVAGDFNRDGQEDLVIAHPYEGALTFYLGDGNGGFCLQSRQTVATASCCPTMDLGAVDVNADGSLDLVVANGDTVSVWLNGLAATSNTPPTITSTSTAMSAGSNNLTTIIATVGDAETPASNLQVEVTSRPAAITINNLTNSNGTIRATFTINCSAPVGEQRIGLKVTDAGGLSASAELKLTVAANSAPTLGAYSDVVLGVGNTVVTPNRTPSDSGAVTGVTIAAQGYSGQLTVDPQGIVTIVNNGITGRYQAVVTARDNCGAAAFATFYFTILGTPGACSAIGFKNAVNLDAGATPQSLATSDVNGDGVPDLVVVNRDSNKITILLGTNTNGIRSFSNAGSYEVGVDPRAVTIQDFDHDGKVDLAVVNRSPDKVMILRGNGDGSFVVAGSYDCGNKPFSVAVGDFNGDGNVDLVVVNDGLGNLAILDGKGDGSFGAPRYFYAGSSPQPALVGDFNKDGKADIVVANFLTNQITVLLGLGEGNFATPHSYDTGTGSAPSPLALGDLNNDGKVDLVVGKTGFSQVVVMIGFGNGSFGFQTAFVAGREPQSLVVADFDGDGRQDIAVGNYQANSVTVFPGVGTGFYDTLKGIYYNVGLRPLSLLGGDFNGDGKPDLVVANNGSNSISILVNGCSER